ncbi:MAG: hypothetical protein MK081_13825 [Flavobacteriales bacterium]|nr:hypothetical protein [Flavobacteriales bacterium]
MKEETKKYFIPINRDTVKPNENAGQDSSKELVGVRHWFYISGEVPTTLELSTDYHIVDMNWDSDGNVEGIIEAFDQYVKVREVLTSAEVLDKHELRAEYIEYGHRPVPDFSFEYEDVEVQCGYCSSKFSHTMLKEQEEYDNEHDLYLYSTEICPVCNRGGCCEVEYESAGSTDL